MNQTNTIEQRLRAIEDRLEILNLIASHPPSADTGADYYTVQVYAEDGVFDRGENLMGATGNKEVAAIMQTPPQFSASSANWSGWWTISSTIVAHITGDCADHLYSAYSRNPGRSAKTRW